MKDASTFQQLSEAIGRATRSARFCVTGVLSVVDPGLEVTDLGSIKFPLKRAVAKQLIACCRIAPYGKGTRTLVNTKVRKTFELNPRKFRLGDAWKLAIAEATQTAAQQLGLPVDRLDAKLYKLLVYERGGFFLPHRDSEKQNRMLGSLIVVLPNPFQDGDLIVRHGAIEQRLTFDEAAAGQSPCFAAFYADCEHEVKPITSGVRVALAYNLVLKPQRRKPVAATKPVAFADRLAESIEAWATTQPGKPLVFALDHHYTQHGLSLDLLKGGDRKLANLVALAADKSDCLVHLAQVQRHVSQYADDGYYGYGHRYRSSRNSPRELVIGETYEDDLRGTQWTDLDGKQQPWGTIAFDHSAIVSSVPLEDWKPTSEEFEGYTGNAGNTLDRWYHRSAIVVWRRQDHYDVVASSGEHQVVPLFNSQAAKLAKTPKKRLEDARRDCLRFARAIIAKWPRRTFGYERYSTREKTPLDDFPKHLLLLHDRETVALFLSRLAGRDYSLPLKSFVVQVCREFGASAFAAELKRLLAKAEDIRGRQEIPFRDVEWLAGLCCDKQAALENAALAKELCAVAVARFCEPFPPGSPQGGWYHREEPTVSEKSLSLLFKALLTCGRDEGLSQVTRLVQQAPDEFPLDRCQVPCLKALVPWSEKQLGCVHPSLKAWLASVRAHLETATAKPPVPPTDWTRPASVQCRCQSCAQLNSFLADPANGTGRMPAREEVRRHLVDSICRYQCDVKHTLEKKRSPFTLVLTKTTGSFDRAMKRFEADRRLLKALPSAS